jgi:flagellar protein FliS
MISNAPVFISEPRQTSSPWLWSLCWVKAPFASFRVIAAIKSKDLNAKRQSVDRAVAVVQHLHGTLDMERGGEVAADLNRLYNYITSCILDGSAKLETAPLEEAIKLLRVLLTGWEELARKEQNSAAAATTVAPQATSTGFELHA